MYKALMTTIMVGSGFVAIAAFFQWSVILERCLAGVWGYFKFWGYGGGGYMAAGIDTQIIFFFLSGCLALTGFLLSNRRVFSSEKRIWRFQRRLAMVSGILLVVGILFWGAFLISPLVVFVNR